MNDPTHTPHHLNLARRIPAHLMFVPLGGLAALPIYIGEVPLTDPNRKPGLHSVPKL